MLYKSSQLIDNPLVSVILLAYNQEILINETLKGILNQKTNFPFEIIISENCSTDNTKIVCLEYFKKFPEKIILICNEKNIGPNKNYFQAANYVRGKYIAVCPDDDWWIDNHKLQKQVGFMENNNEYNLVYTKARIFLQKSLKYKRKAMGYDCTQFEKMIVSDQVPALTMCFTKQSFLEFVKEIKPLERNFPCEDYAFLIWLTFRKKIFFMKEEIGGVFRIRGESVSMSNDPERVFHLEEERREIRMYFYNYFNVLDEKLLNKMELKYYMETMRWAPLIKNSENINERNQLFLKNHLYVLHFFSNLYAACGTNRLLNDILFFIERVLRKFGIVYYIP
jgi:glycosyltransferase involved in cell wall biosynthesis